LREQVQGQCDKIDITGALTVAKQAAFDALSASQHTKFCRGNTTTTIIVRVKRYYHTVAVLDAQQQAEESNTSCSCDGGGASQQPSKPVAVDIDAARRAAQAADS